MAIALAGTPASNTASSTQVVVTVTTSTGNCVVVVVAIRTNTSTVSSVVDSGGSSYTQKAAINGTNERVEIWSTTATGSKASTSVTVNLSATSKVDACVAQYSGVVTVKNPITGTQTTANPTITQTVDATSSWTVSGFAGQGTGTFSASVGNLRTSIVSSGGSAASNVGGSLTDNTGGTSNTCTNTNADTDWSKAAIELSLTAGSVPVSGSGNIGAAKTSLISSAKPSKTQTIAQTKTLVSSAKPTGSGNIGQTKSLVSSAKPTGSGQIAQTKTLVVSEKPAGSGQLSQTKSLIVSEKPTGSGSIGQTKTLIGSAKPTGTAGVSQAKTLTVSEKPSASGNVAQTYTVRYSQAISRSQSIAQTWSLFVSGPSGGSSFVLVNEEYG